MVTSKKDIATSRKKIINATSKAIKDFSMIEDDDFIMICISGGKDSYTMLDMMIHLQKYGNTKFNFIVVNMDQKQPGFPKEILPKYLNNLDLNYKIIEKDTYSIVKEKIPEGKTMCSLCSRLRRGTLYDLARDLNCNKIALGHHMDDIIEATMEAVRLDIQEPINLGHGVPLSFLELAEKVFEVAGWRPKNGIKLRDVFQIL